MIIELTKNYTKPNGKVLKKGLRISVTSGHPYKDFAIVQKDGKIDKEKEIGKLIDNTKINK